MQLVEWAEATARDRLAAALSRRWSHVQAVAHRASQLSEALRRDGDLLQAAAWLHDVGYAPELALTGFHPLDGARFLASADVDVRLVGLVAFHSSAAAESEMFGVADQLREFSDERTLTRDLLWWCDMTIGPDGQCMSFTDRMDDVRERYGPMHYVTQALDRGMAERLGAVQRAESWIASVGLSTVLRP